MLIGKYLIGKLLGQKGNTIGKVDKMVCFYSKRRDLLLLVHDWIAWEGEKKWSHVINWITLSGS